ncbi:MAG: ribosome biogenesis GTPase, partial [Pseudohongiellaceae bacterium]
MSKRRLSKHQLARISQNQRKELGFDKTDSVDAQTSLEKCNGRIISHYGQHVDVESLITEDEGRLIRCTQRSNLPRLVTGDLVVWSDDGADGGVVLALGQR